MKPPVAIERAWTEPGVLLAIGAPLVWRAILFSDCRGATMRILYQWIENAFCAACMRGVLRGVGEAAAVLSDGRVQLDQPATLTLETVDETPGDTPPEPEKKPKTSARTKKR